MESEPSRPLAVLIKALVWFVVGAANRVDKSVTTASMLSRLWAERSVSMAPMEDSSAESRLVSDAVCRSTRVGVNSVSLTVRDSGAKEGEAYTIGSTNARETNLDKCMLSA